jgi:hypothetical protein
MRITELKSPYKGQRENQQAKPSNNVRYYVPIKISGNIDRAFDTCFRVHRIVLFPVAIDGQALENGD